MPLPPQRHGVAYWRLISLFIVLVCVSTGQAVTGYFAGSFLLQLLYHPLHAMVCLVVPFSSSHMAWYERKGMAWWLYLCGTEKCQARWAAPFIA